MSVFQTTLVLVLFIFINTWREMANTPVAMNNNVWQSPLLQRLKIASVERRDGFPGDSRGSQKTTKL